MADRHINPGDGVDLSVLAESFGDTLGTLYPVAVVYGPPNNTEITGSPFTLTLFGNNLYGLDNAFQADISSGTYKIVYIFYTDSGHTVRSTEHGEKHETITVSVQSTTGLGRESGASLYYDDTLMRKLIDEKFEKLKVLEKKVDSLQEDFNAGLKIDIPIFDDSRIISEIKNKTFDESRIIKAITEKSFDDSKILGSLKTKYENLILAIKKNRSIIIKNKFDKSQMLPILKVVSELDLKVNNNMRDFIICMTRTLDLKNKETENQLIKVLNERNYDDFIMLFNSLGNDIRIKLLYIFTEVNKELKKNFKKLEPQKTKYKSKLFDEK